MKLGKVNVVCFWKKLAETELGYLLKGTLLQIWGFDLMTRYSYFTILVEVITKAKTAYFTNHIEWTEHKLTVLKPANKY